MSHDKLSTTDWSAYLRSFHDEHAGITEEILRRSRTDEDMNPYKWALAAIPDRPGPVLDLACGNAPMWEAVARWLPEPSRSRVLAVRRYLRMLAGLGVEMPIPLQRIIAAHNANSVADTTVPKRPSPLLRPSRYQHINSRRSKWTGGLFRWPPRGRRRRFS
jgi:hypothetical protein